VRQLDEEEGLPHFPRAAESNLAPINEQENSENRPNLRLSSKNIKDENKVTPNEQISLDGIFENGSNGRVSREDSQTPGGNQRPDVFDDSLDRFVEILKKTTQASEINMFSKDLI